MPFLGGLRHFLKGELSIEPCDPRQSTGDDNRRGRPAGWRTCPSQQRRPLHGKSDFFRPIEKRGAHSAPPFHLIVLSVGEAIHSVGVVQATHSRRRQEFGGLKNYRAKRIFSSVYEASILWSRAYSL